ALAASHPPARHVVVDAESVNLIDITAAETLLAAIRELQDQGITLAFARVRDEVREPMRLAGVEAAVGPENFHERVTDGVLAWQRKLGERGRRRPRPKRYMGARQHYRAPPIPVTGAPPWPRRARPRPVLATMS